MLFGYINPDRDVIVVPKITSILSSNNNNNYGDMSNYRCNINGDSNNVDLDHNNNDVEDRTESSQPQTKRIKIK